MTPSLERRENPRHTVAIAACDFGWGSVGKLRLILDALPPSDLVPYLLPKNGMALLGESATRHRIVATESGGAGVALVVNDPPAAEALAARGLAVIYVDSLPYLWVSAAEIPKPGSTAIYCAQKFPRGRYAPSPVLAGRRDLRWIEPIVAPTRGRHGGEGVVLNLGGVHSHLATSASTAYEALVLPAAVDALVNGGHRVLAVCGGISDALAARMRARLGPHVPIGPLPARDFEALLRRADLLVSSPGSTTLLQAISIGLPTVLLPPQNLSQIFNARLYLRPDRRPLDWPDAVLSIDHVEALRPEGEEVVVRYIYDALARAAAEPALVDIVAAALAAALDHCPDGDLRNVVAELGGRGALQVAQMVRQACLAPFAI